MKTLTRLALLCLLPVLAMACGSSSTEAGATITGTYTLKTVDGNALPVQVTVDGNTAQITNGSAALSADNKFSALFGVKVTYGGTSYTTSQPISGTYTVTGDSITATITNSTLVPNGTVVTGTVVDNTLSVTINGSVYVFKK